jgi:hypothetical protein
MRRSDGPQPAIIEIDGAPGLHRVAPAGPVPLITRSLQESMMHRLSCLYVLLALLLSVSAHALDDAPLAVSAAQYLQLIRDSRDAAGQTTAVLSQQAEQQALQRTGPPPSPARKPPSPPAPIPSRRG